MTDQCWLLCFLKNGHRRFNLIRHNSQSRLFWYFSAMWNNTSIEVWWTFSLQETRSRLVSLVFLRLTADSDRHGLDLGPDNYSLFHRGRSVLWWVEIIITLWMCWVGGYELTMASNFLVDNDDTSALEANVKNKWRWSWLQEYNKNGVQHSTWCKKINVPGKCICISCVYFFVLSDVWVKRVLL